MNQRIPKPIQPVLENYLLQVDQQLPDLMSALYVEGSIALGGFNERFSDIDFVAILNRRAISIELESLRSVHKVIEKNYPRWKMSGSYLQSDELDHFDDEVESPHPYYHDGMLRLDGRFELHSVTGWLLKNHGIAVIGPEPQELSFTVDWNLLMTKMKGNLNSYWVSWTKRLDRIVVMLFDWGIQWTVLGVLRQFYSFRENTITTKEKAAEYALNCVPSLWHRLIREAIDIRAGRQASAYRFRVVRTVEAVNFLKYIIQSCNAGLT
jgi:hypothetical protein